jgi:glycosyltransferase involved in cell wall biosynthesis
VNYHDYQGKDVLLIGDNTFTEAAAALEHGADIVETIPAKPGSPSDSDKLLDWPGRKDWANEGVVQVRNVAGTTLEDAEAWDDVVISGVGQAELPEVMRRAQRAVRPLGKVLVHKTGVDYDGELRRPPPAIELDDSAERKVMLHVHNVQRCGGTGNFVYDMARCFGNFEHVALCVNDPAGDPVWLRDASNIMRTMYAPQITEELLDEINPRVVVLHATTGGKVAGDWPYPWLQAGGKRYVIRLHHIPTHPIFPADLSVFVSEYIKSRYTQFLGKQIPRWIVMPPCTDLAPYAAIARPPHGRGKVATTGGKACPEMQALMKTELADWKWDSSPPGRIGQFARYLGRFPFAVIWSGHQETWCRTVTEALAAGCVVIAHRAGAIPEQIEHGVNGFLFDGAEDLVPLMAEVQSLGKLELAEIAQRGRAWAVKAAGFERMKADLYPYLTEALMEA